MHVYHDLNVQKMNTRTRTYLSALKETRKSQKRLGHPGPGDDLVPGLCAAVLPCRP
jgi:hypothetical protein